MMSGSAGFHADQASRNPAKEVDDLHAPQLTGDDDLAQAIHAVHLEHVLGEINADGANLHMDDPSSDSLFNDHSLAHSMPGAGVVHHTSSNSAYELMSASTPKATKIARRRNMSRWAKLGSHGLIRSLHRHEAETTPGY
jgi:hypothetical protein